MQSLTVPIKKSQIKLNIIQCYVPTNDADDKKKDAFYLLHIVLNKAGKNDMTILMGDFNAKMGDFNVTENQIEHICTNKKCRAMEDVRVIRGAKVSSDHYPLMTAARVLLKKLNNMTTRGQDTT